MRQMVIFSNFVKESQTHPVRKFLWYFSRNLKQNNWTVNLQHYKTEKHRVTDSTDV